MREYKTRKHQIEAFIRQAKLPLKIKAEKARFHKAMRDACMVGAAEERYRVLKILQERNDLRGIEGRIIRVPVLEVLGFEKAGE